jgi:maltooligosyltrehalose trehalohydrolase
MSSSQQRRCGALALPGGAVRWRVWAPKVETVDLVLIDDDHCRVVAMEREERGFFRHTEPEVAEGHRYAFRLGGGPERPDPCSLSQPEGVHGPSAVVRPERFRWTDRAWKGVAREDLAFYELHVGTFTPQGTFDAIISRLPELREIGITAIELMPVSQFPGTRNWGYDGVNLYAVQNGYGGPQGLARFVDACHSQGLALFLDVVYNHFGPEGNYLGEFGPYFTDRYKTPWGLAVNYDGPGSDPVRDFVLDNARMWLDEFHVDGLRLDAAHAIFDLGARHILLAIKEVADDVAKRTGKPRLVIAESDLNDPRILRDPERGGYGLDAQWSDDFHHVVHTLFTGEREGYYQDFGEARHLAAVMERPFLYAWDYSPHRDRKHGAPPADLPGDRFVVCLQNHDQVGNRARGDRLTTLLDDPRKLRLAAGLLLLAPHVPMLFMGEEYGETSPFPFFCSFGEPELVEAVREGRKREFAEFANQGQPPDPDAEATFASARPSWSWSEPTRAGLRQLYRDLLAARRTFPQLRDFVRRRARLLPDTETGPVLELVRGEDSRIVFNLSDRRQEVPAAETYVWLSTEAPRYAGMREDRDLSAMLPFECMVFGPAKPFLAARDGMGSKSALHLNDGLRPSSGDSAP